MKTVLTVAGSDSIGGAGIEADLKAIACHDLHGAAAITAVTFQNTRKVSGIVPLKAETVIAQIDAVLEDADVRAVKTGMLYSDKIAEPVADRLEGENLRLVVDPVLVAGVGDRLYSPALIRTLKEKVLPLATIVTPNRHEAEVLASMTINGIEDAEEACRKITCLGPEAVLLKGGHFDGDGVMDLLYHRGRMMSFEGPRLDLKVHGGGCTVASYLACCLAKNKSLRNAVLDSKRRIYDAIALSYQAGQGVRIVNPLASKQKEAMRADHIEELSWAIGVLEEKLPAEWVPEVGSDFVYALPAPQGYDQVCGAMGGIVNIDGTVAAIGDVRFGSSTMASRLILGMNGMDTKVLSMLELRSSREHLATLKEQELVTIELNDLLKGRSARKEAEGLHGTKQTDFVPDIIFDWGGMGAEPMVRIVGNSPMDVLRKLGPILF